MLTNEECFLKDLSYLQDLGVKIKIFQNLQDKGGYVLEINGTKQSFNTSQLKDFLEKLKDEIESVEEQEAKKRRMFRTALLEASEEIAMRFNKQVYTLSIGDKE